MLLGKIKKQFPNIKTDEPLKNHCTFRVGGPADLFYELLIIEELPELITFAEENSIPYTIIGRGTNVLFTDKGFRGLIIKNLTRNICVDDGSITADSGVILSKIISLSIDNNLTGLEPLYGIPGSLGGAIWGNAGVPGTEIGNFLKSITIFNVSDGIREVPSDEIQFGYRWTSLQQKHEIILGATLGLNRSNQRKSKELIKKNNDIRLGKQPVGYSAGSFFKNPSLDKSAGFLIDQVDLKGKSIGDAEISPRHGNFFMNKGNATAEQILKLAKLAKEKVKEKFGIELHMEVKIIGDL